MRNHSTMYATMWATDEDYLALPPYAKLVYQFLVQQPEMDLCGALPLRERRWQALTLIPSTEFTQSLNNLEQTRFVVPDYVQGELWVRSRMKYGVIDSPNALIGARKDFAKIRSPKIRQAFVEQYPEQAEEWAEDYLDAELLKESSGNSSWGGSRPGAGRPSIQDVTDGSALISKESSEGNPSQTPSLKGSKGELESKRARELGELESKRALPTPAASATSQDSVALSLAETTRNGLRPKAPAGGKAPRPVADTQPVGATAAGERNGTVPCPKGCGGHVGQVGDSILCSNPRCGWFAKGILDKLRATWLQQDALDAAAVA